MVINEKIETALVGMRQMLYFLADVESARDEKQPLEEQGLSTADLVNRYGAVSMWFTAGLYGGGEHQHPVSPKEDLAMIMRLALKHGMDVRKDYETNTFDLRVDVPNAHEGSSPHVTFYTARNEVCEVVGEEEYEEEEEVELEPAVTELQTVTKTRSLWDCASILKD
jgi:hypothetical protein